MDIRRFFPIIVAISEGTFINFCYIDLQRDHTEA